MMSKRLFLKMMKEDMRHRLWMIALSCLGSFLMLPVTWLVLMSTNSGSPDLLEWEQAMVFFSQYFVLLGTCFTIVGALIVGSCGFRFVFHKEMTDLYHSIPVRRRTLFLVCYLDGLLIWFVPLALNLAVTLLMAMRSLMRWFGAAQMCAVLRCAGLTLALLILVFMVFYHLVLTAVMLSGNPLNTFVTMIMLGFGEIIIYLLCMLFAEVYLETCCWSDIHQAAVYASPPVSAVNLMIRLGDYFYRSGFNPAFAELAGPILANAVMAAILWLAAYGLYVRRPSELAHQGVKNKVMNPLMKLAGGITAGLAGWMFFYGITVTSDFAPAWGVFGALLFGVVIFGVMNICFSMDFKAFFTHKRQMFAAVAASLLIAFAFYGDWFGYDHYLPGKNAVEEIAIYDRTASMAMGTTYTSRSVLASMHLRDTDAAYAFLERMAASGESGKGDIGSLWYVENEQETLERGETVRVRVTLKSGRTYYREYYVTSKDKDVAWPLYSSREYLENSYLLPEVPVQYGETFISRGSRREQFELSPEQVAELTEAYNQDVMEDPDVILTGRARALLHMGLRMHTEKEPEDGPEKLYSLTVFDTMRRTVGFLERIGYGDYTEEIPADHMEELDVFFGAETRNDPVRKTVITDREEIEELAERFSYVSGSDSVSAFRDRTVLVKVYDGEDDPYNCWIPVSMLPEKYLPADD